MTIEPANLSDDALAILPQIEAVDRWIASARDVFRSGAPVVVTFSPGDMTTYVMAFVSAYGIVQIDTRGEYQRVRNDEAILALLGPSPSSTLFNPLGCPNPDYVATHLRGVVNPNTIASVGVCWSLMASNSPARVAAFFASHAAIIGRWDLDLL